MLKKRGEHRVNGGHVLRKNVRFRVRTLSGVNYLFGDNLCFELNAVANDIWDNINGFDDIEDVIGNIAAAYDVPACDIREDVLGFIDGMVEKDVFLVVNE